MAATAGLRTSVRRTRGSECVHMARVRAGGMRVFEGDAHLFTSSEDGRRPSVDGPEVGPSTVGPRPASIRPSRLSTALAITSERYGTIPVRYRRAICT